MGVIELVDRSAATALTRASQLQQQLRSAEAESDSDPSISECRAEVHRLVADIVSLRNAAELLKREVRAAS